MNQHDYLMDVLMTTNGLRVFISNGKNIITHSDDSEVSIVAGSRVHFALVWDFSLDRPTVVDIYINGQLSSSVYKATLQEEFSLSMHRDVFLMVGGKSWSGFATKDVSGLDGVIDNLRVYNYPRRDFSSSLSDSFTLSTKKSRDMVELSLDGTNFFGYGSSSLPLLVRDVYPDALFNFFVRGKDEITSTVDGEKNRKTKVEISRFI